MKEFDPIIGKDWVERFSAVGRDLFLTGAVSSHGGNMSVRVGDRIIITRRGSMLGRIGVHDVVWTHMAACDLDEECSREIVVHRAIYKATGASAIVHAHPEHTIYRSLIESSITPIDSEAAYVLGASIPVVSAQQTIASPEAAVKLAEILEDRKIAVLKSHGPFAVGDTLEEAFYHVSALEVACRILDIRDSSCRGSAIREASE